MLFFIPAFLILSFASNVFSSPYPAVHHILHEKRHSAPPQWEKRSKLDTRTVVPVRIALNQRNLHKAEDFIYDVSHPKSLKYGQHWTPKEIAEAFAPSKDDIHAVRNWLHDAGIDKTRVKLSQGLNWLQFDATISEAERLFKTEYYIFEHTQTRTPHIACHEYHLPAHISNLVDFVTPSVHFDAKVGQHEDPKRHMRKLPSHMVPKSAKKELKREIKLMTAADADRQIEMIRPGEAASVGMRLGSLPKQGAVLGENEAVDAQELEDCDRTITPNCVRALYQFGPGESANQQNTLGIVEYAPQSYVESDLDKFFANFSAKMVGERPVLQSIDGGQIIKTDQSFDMNGEADLDLQIAMPLVYPIKITLYQVGETKQGASFNNFLDAIDGTYCTFEGGDDPSQDAVYPDKTDGYIGPANCGGYAATKVISTSFGYNEADLTPKYAQRQCAEYMKLALQGITVLYSSGDYGVAGNQGRCMDPKTGNLTKANAMSGKFNPSFPSGCPWVTSIGATQVPNNTNIVRSLASSTQPEMACETIIRSGGGFSNVFDMPDYQKKQVATYWQDHAPAFSADLFNNSQKTRGFPDVSANGANYIVNVNGNFTLVYGTSASAPTFGSMVTLINEERMKKGKKSVGFINPVLYEHPEVMKDVTQGKNSGCGTPGFSAVEGWDPTTGLGTPIYPKMLDLFMSLP
ncbi:hypothetical protein Vi05172_g412 [Venturia inaequalis]|nr:hypothetical protein Vi05172_g412 [Venturia inaequalis]